MTHFAMGWLPDLPSHRDFTAENMAPMLARVGTPQAASPLVDLRQWCSPIEDQKTIGSCTANAGVGMAEFFQRKAYGKHLDASRLFLYKTTRDLMKLTGDSGASLRSTMEAMTLFGIPPESFWPYLVSKYDQEPSAFLYSFADNYKVIKYYRLDPPGTSLTDLCDRIRASLASGLPLMFGFTVFSSYDQANATGLFPYPAPTDKVVGGHAVMAVGYDDAKQCVLIRNSWSTAWGQQGYGWLPYRYITDGLATDWWSLIAQDWVDTGNFA